MITVRKEKPEDIPAVRAVNESAFGQSHEADIVDKLRLSCHDMLSLVALREERVVGHILFSPVVIEGDLGVIQGMGLAPMAVLPTYQRQGIGSKLVEAGLAILRQRSRRFVIVLGHPRYYPRFGFRPASMYGIQSQWAGMPDEAFMIIILDESVMTGVTGVAKYRGEFEEAMEGCYGYVGRSLPVETVGLCASRSLTPDLKSGAVDIAFTCDEPIHHTATASSIS